MTDYPTLREVLAVHEMNIERYGGAAGVRDLGAIEAALYRPQSGYYADIIEEAAALFESLLINHPFVDGNKRTAFAICYIFLEINGYLLDADPAWLYNRIMAWLEERENRFQHIVDDLRSCVKPV
ncbi:Death-on-curing family protein [uncultured delta proteobacterium]|uniref:Death-on-curing family protein n=1 Tax=uncultured delta proteobacterium TaxID=34034 RepID=A0A212JFA6_9DELT|nr:Death-on-curing family protein [uncultured delta proteobacterium]